MRWSVRCLLIMIFLLLLTAGTGLAASAPYGNAFFANAEGVVLSFLLFLLTDVIRWAACTAGCGARQRRGQEVGWTAAFLLSAAYFLWRHWDRYSFWQGWLIAAVCALSVIGLAVRLFAKWDADCVRWLTWSACCLAVTGSILGCIAFWHPMTLKEAQELVIAETGDDSFTFRYIDSGGTMINHRAAEAPLGYYIFNQKQADGSYGTYGTGRAVVYLGDAQEAYRSPDPKGSPAHSGGDGTASSVPPP